MFKVAMSHGWHSIVFKFEDMYGASNFMKTAMEAISTDYEDKLFFTVEMIKEETEDAEAVCGTEEG